MAGFEPRILGVLCNWCSYSGADGAGQQRIEYPTNVEVVRVMCSGRVDPTLVFDAFARGMDGVLICGCHPGDCHYINGNCKALARFQVMRRMAADLGIEPERLRLEWVSASEGARYAELVAEMTEQVRALGPLAPASRRGLGLMAGKLAIAAYCAAGCGGCEIALLEIHEHILELVEAADIVFWPAIADLKYADVEALEDGSIDVCLFNGAIRTEENAHIAELLRRKSKALVAFGACAAFGGVPGLGNLFDTADVLERAFTTESTDATDVRPCTIGTEETSCVTPLTDRVSALSGVAAVDYVVPGCAPEAAQVWAVCSAIIAGELPSDQVIVGAGDRSVCEECPREKRNTRVSAFVRSHQIVPEPGWCLLEQGVVCMGPATRSGCVRPVPVRRHALPGLLRARR